VFETSNRGLFLRAETLLDEVLQRFELRCGELAGERAEIFGLGGIGREFHLGGFESWPLCFGIAAIGGDDAAVIYFLSETIFLAVHFRCISRVGWRFGRAAGITSGGECGGGKRHSEKRDHKEGVSN